MAKPRLLLAILSPFCGRAEERIVALGELTIRIIKECWSLFPNYADADRVEPLCQRIIRLVRQLGFTTDARTLPVIGFISLLIEHHESILLLTMHDMVGSASALLRPVVEGSYRALWVNLPATDAEVNKFNERDEIDLRFGEIAAALDTAYDMEGFFQNLKDRTWKYLNSYTHGGMQQIGRRFVKNEVANNYSEAEIYEMTTTATTIILLAVSFFLKRQGHMDSGDEIQSFLETFGPNADGKKAEAHP